MQKIVLFWFRRDLRLEDNAGLYAALRSGLPVVPVFIFDADILSHLEDARDQRVSFIYRSLQLLQEKLVAHGSTLDVRYGKPEDVFRELLQFYPVHAVYTNHDYEPYAQKRDKTIRHLLESKGILFYTFKDQVIFEKDEVVKEEGTGYMIYTPYAKKWRALLSRNSVQPFPSEKLVHAFFQQPPIAFPSLQAMNFSFNEDIPVRGDVDQSILQHYHETRNIPSVHGTTRLGVHLRFGTISIRRLLSLALRLNDVYVGELIWREFFMQILWHQPRLVQEACKRDYDRIQWRNNEEEFQRWCAGETGVPIVDAGMRELNATGFMHNRVRMIVGSYLVKDLLVDWRWGEAYFAQKLLDFELASNNGNWQWVAGCGCDAAPYFRVFNPDTQAKKFDPKEIYTRKWIPELDKPAYPKPVVDHNFAKERCIKAYKSALSKTDR